MRINSISYNNAYKKSNNPKHTFALKTDFSKANTSKVKFGQGMHFFPFNYETLDIINPNNTMRRLKSKTEEIVQTIKVPTKNGMDLNSWFIKPKEDKPVFLFLNGTNSNRTWQQEVVTFFDENGYGALMPDYRGFGDNPGIATEVSLYEDAEASLKFLNDQGLNDKKLILWGYSLGGAVARHIAPMNNFRFGIIDSAITNENAIKNHFIRTGLADIQRISQAVLAKLNIEAPECTKIPFDTTAKIKEVKYPLLFIHSKGDEIVPYEMTEKQAAFSQNKLSKLVISGNAPHIHRSWTFKHIKDFDESLPHKDYSI